MLSKEYLLNKGFEEVMSRKYDWKEAEFSMRRFSFLLFPYSEGIWEFNWRGGNTYISTEEHLERLYEALLERKL